MGRKNFDKCDIESLVDHELDPETEQQLLAYIEENADARRYFQMLLDQKDRVITWWKTQKNN